MPFLVPIYFSMKAAKTMQFTPSIMRVNFLKNIYYARICSYLTFFLSVNLYLK
jgi:small basic protein